MFLQRFGASEAVAECAGLGVQGTEGSEVQGFPLAPIFVHCFFRVVRCRLVSSSFRAVFAPHFLMRSAKLWERRVLAGIVGFRRVSLGVVRFRSVSPASFFFAPPPVATAAA